MPTLQGQRSGPPEVPINRLKTGPQTIAASIKANIRGIISQGPAVLLMAQPPIAACLVAARIYFFFVFSELPMCFFALQCFHSDLHLELLFSSPPIHPYPKTSWRHASPPCSAFPLLSLYSGPLTHCMVIPDGKWGQRDLLLLPGVHWEQCASGNPKWEWEFIFHIVIRLWFHQDIIIQMDFYQVF